MVDGNRRWARKAGHTDVREGYRAGGAKVTTFLGWCTAAGIEHVTLFMLSDDNLGRPAEELGPLIEVIEETVRDITAEGRDWEVRAIGSLDMLPGASARVLKEATAATAGRGGLKVDVAVGYGGSTRDRRRREERFRGAHRGRMATRPNWSPGSGSTTSPGTSTHPWPTTPTSSSAPPGSSGCPVSSSGSPPTPRCTGWTATGRPSATWTSCARCARTRTENAASASDGPRTAPARSVPYRRARFTAMCSSSRSSPSFRSRPVICWIRESR